MRPRDMLSRRGAAAVLSRTVTVLPRAARAGLRGWHRFYGENPMHLLAMLGCFALAGYVVSMVYTDPSASALAVWFLGAVIGHDLVMYPLYALADQPLVISRWARRKILPRHPPRVPAINHIRVPALASGVLGLIYLPSITLHSADAFRFAAGHDMQGQYQNWLLSTGVLSSPAPSSTPCASAPPRPQPPSPTAVESAGGRTARTVTANTSTDTRAGGTRWRLRGRAGVIRRFLCMPGHDASVWVGDLGPVAVDPDHQGLGLGAELMSSVAAVLDRLGVADGFLTCDPQVRPFRERCGRVALTGT